MVHRSIAVFHERDHAMGFMRRALGCAANESPERCLLKGFIPYYDAGKCANRDPRVSANTHVFFDETQITKSAMRDMKFRMQVYILHQVDERYMHIPNDKQRNVILLPFDVIALRSGNLEEIRTAVAYAYQVPSTHIFYVFNQSVCDIPPRGDVPDFLAVEYDRAIRAIFGMEEQVLALCSAGRAQQGALSAMHRMPRELVEEVFNMVK